MPRPTSQQLSATLPLNDHELQSLILPQELSGSVSVSHNDPVWMALTGNSTDSNQILDVGVSFTGWR